MTIKRQGYRRWFSSRYRYEILMFALLQLVFNKIFFPDSEFYLEVIWPINMVLMALASYGLFVDKSRRSKQYRNVLCSISILMPFLFVTIGPEPLFLQFLVIFFVVFYCFIFVEVMRQITRVKAVKLNVVIGSFCGFFLLHLITTFCFLWLALNQGGSFTGIDTSSAASIYNEVSYFSLITLTTIGYGDISPVTDAARLTVAFFGVLGQFYTVAIVGIIVSRFD